MQGKYSDALALLDDDSLSGVWKDEDEKIRARHRIYNAIGKHDDTIAMFRAALRKDVNCDNWYYITSYIDAEVQHIKSSEYFGFRPFRYTPAPLSIPLLLHPVLSISCTY